MVKIRLNHNDIKRMINEAVRRILREGYEDGLQPRLSKLVSSKTVGGKITQVNLPDGVLPKDIADEDIKKITQDPGGEKYYIKLSSGFYIIISPDAEAIVHAKEIEDRDAELRRKRDAEIEATPISQLEQIPYESPEDRKERIKKEREEKRKEERPRTMKAVQEIIEKKYGEYLELLSTRTRRGRNYVYQARLYYTAASYADGPSYIDDDVIEAVTKYLEPFGFYYAGSHEEHDERQWSNEGWHVWKRRGAIDPYEAYLMRHADDDDYGW